MKGEHAENKQLEIKPVDENEEEEQDPEGEMTPEEVKAYEQAVEEGEKKEEEK